MSRFTQLEELAKKDFELRNDLIGRGELFGDYHLAMESLHIENGYQLQQLVDRYGWPKKTIDGKAAVDAAFTILIHAISLPDLQRNILNVFKQQPELISSQQLAMLEDRMLVFSGKKQIYGTQMDWDEHGMLSPFPIEDLEHVDERRRSIGLETLSEAIEKLRQRAVLESENPPQDLKKYSELRESWMLRVGWINNYSEIDPAYDKYRTSS